MPKAKSDVRNVIVNPAVGMWGFNRNELLFKLGETGSKPIDVGALDEFKRKLYDAAIQAGDLREITKKDEKVLASSDELQRAAYGILSYKEEQLLGSELDKRFGTAGGPATVEYAVQLLRKCVELEEKGKGPTDEPRLALLKEMKKRVVYLNRFKQPHSVKLEDAYSKVITVEVQKDDVPKEAQL